MRDRELIEREIYAAREDLEASLAQLKHAVREKVDVKARARVAVEKGKARAEELLDRGTEGALDLYCSARMVVRERPVLVASIAGGVVALAILGVVGRKRDWF